MHQDLESLLEPVLDIAVRAGDKILEIYATDFEVETKEDESPLTAADKASHNTIVAANITQRSNRRNCGSTGISVNSAVIPSMARILNRLLPTTFPMATSELL